MNKELYWIDDDVPNILDLAQHTFPVLWGLDESDHIINKVILFGDDLKKGLDSELLDDKRERNIIHRLTGYFKDNCNEIGQADPEHNLFEEKRYLTKDIFRLFAKIPTEITPEKDQEKQNELIELTKRIIDFWKNTDKVSNKEEYKKNQSDIHKLVEAFAIPEDAFVAIDLVLLFMDDKRVKNENKILSMELYHKLSSTRPGRCFVYSRYISDVKLASTWEKIYHENYDSKAEIKLYKKKDFNAKEANGMRLLNQIRNEILKG